MGRSRRIYDYYDKLALAFYGAFDKLGDASRKGIDYLLAPSSALIDVSSAPGAGATHAEAENALEIARDYMKRIRTDNETQETFRSFEATVKFSYEEGRVNRIAFSSLGWFGNYRRSSEKVRRMAEGLGLKVS